tara:strand:+ start:217 stop:585 length:369 start_codon:yes stop_codon:yes gene_type:complete
MMNGIRISLISTLLVGCASAPVTDPARACSPPADGSEFTCPDFDGVILDPPPVLGDPPVLMDPPPIQKTSTTVYDSRPVETSPSGWIQGLREWKSRQNRIPIDESINSALAEYNNGSYEATE